MIIRTLCYRKFYNVILVCFILILNLSFPEFGVQFSLDFMMLYIMAESIVLLSFIKVPLIKSHFFKVLPSNHLFEQYVADNYWDKVYSKNKVLNEND